MSRSTLSCFALLSLAACSPSASSNPSDLGPAPTDLAPSNALVAARHYEYDIPADYDGTRPTPLVVLLHGYSASGAAQRIYFGLNKIVDSRGFFLAWPDGTRDSRGNLFWNATDACCNFDGSDVDDVAYVNAVIDDMSAHFHIDPKRIFVTGHSNGGFMSHRFACDHAERVAAIVALAGDSWLDESKCAPSQPVAILQVHGDADESVLYQGEAKQPSARGSVAGWAKKNGCLAMPTDTMQLPIDLEKNLNGAETVKERWTGCKTGGAAELWTIKGGKHLPIFQQPAWPEAIWGWFAAHPKP